MNDEFRHALEVLEQLTQYLKRDEANYHLILISHSYIKLNDLSSCRRILSKIDPKYMNSQYIYKEIDSNKEFAEKLADIMEVFGIYLHKIVGSEFISN